VVLHERLKDGRAARLTLMWRGRVVTAVESWLVSPSGRTLAMTATLARPGVPIDSNVVALAKVVLGDVALVPPNADRWRDVRADLVGWCVRQLDNGGGR
jgi:hypothetical protein